MSEEREKPVWPWLVAVLIWLPVLYVASFGPACWLVDRDWSYASTTASVYWPVVRLAYSGPDWIKRPIQWWTSVGTEDGISEQPFVIDLLWLQS
jgi:hypothetical protein